MRALRAAGALSLSLIAEDDGGGVIGHVAAPPVRVDGLQRCWYGLGPLAVEPARQRGGVGSALMRATLETLTERGAAGCLLVGDPAYYVRFGLAPLPRLELPGVPAEVFVGRVLAGRPPAARSRSTRGSRRLSGCPGRRRSPRRLRHSPTLVVNTRGCGHNGAQRS